MTVVSHLCSFCDKPAKIDYEWDVFRRSHCLSDECVKKVGYPQPNAKILAVYYQYNKAPTWKFWKQVLE